MSSIANGRLTHAGDDCPMAEQSRIASRPGATQRKKYNAKWRAKNVPRRRKSPIVRLGGRCKFCGRKRRLEFHHLGKRTWIASKTSRCRRMVHSEREAAAGLLVLACRRCNASLGEPINEDW